MVYTTQYVQEYKKTLVYWGSVGIHNKCFGVGIIQEVNELKKKNFYLYKR